ncbi:MAG: amidase family protein, partial [Candidatus Shapirobacteria bacterium]|nr:amidase family protein [Candidatus Shapirobacteria bacterium]
MDLKNLTISQIQELLFSKKISVVDIVNFYLERIKKLDPQIKAFITVTEKEALIQAKNLDDKIKKGDKVGKLAGAVMAV